MTISMNKYDLIIFDMDGTLADRDTGELLDGVAEYFQSLGDKPLKFALATNQGGVGLRHWMKSDGFGEPGKYPDLATVIKHINDVVNRILYAPEELHRIDIVGAYRCYAYVSKKGVLGPAPNGESLNHDWNPNCRKPRPGMLVRAMLDANCHPGNTLMVGDRDEDKGVAENAGCDFMWAWDFFGREKPEGEE